MKPEKLSLKSIKKVLGKDELKKIMAGSGGGTGTGGGCSAETYGNTISCHDRTGYVLGTIINMTYCSWNPCTLPICREYYPTAVSATGSIC